MKWMWLQQVRLLLQSMGLGFILAILFDLFSIIEKLHIRSKIGVFIADTLFGLLSALITFFVSLAIMDGRMHPLLFVGSFLGFFVQHISLGHMVSPKIYKLFLRSHSLFRSIKTKMFSPLFSVFNKIPDGIGRQFKKILIFFKKRLAISVNSK